VKIRSDLIADLRVWATVQPEAADAIEHLQAENARLRAQNERLLKIEMAARNLVDNSYTPSCDGDRQRWMMLQAAMRGEGK